uniref:Uncharacterized protein n=1 Tax=Ditylenchus dipsaci TaxID=166011 RepID=A0A915EDI4_9BILA
MLRQDEKGPGKAKLAASQQNNTGVFSHQWSNNRQMSSSEEETFKQLFARATESTPTHQQQQQFNMVHQSDQYNNNLAALIGTLAQHQQLQSQQQQQSLPPQTAYFPLQATPMAASQLPENTLSALIAKQQEAATVNSQNYSAANILASQQAMQIAIQKELQILYQRHYLQQIMQQQQQLAQNSNASLLSPPPSSSDQTDQSTGYATSCSPYSMSNSSSSLCSSNASNENSNSSNPAIYSQQDSAQPPYNRTLTEKESLAVMVLAGGFLPDSYS